MPARLAGNDPPGCFIRTESMENINYKKIIVNLIEHFINNEGTDCLGIKGEAEYDFEFDELTQDERTELGKLRDIARTNVGWDGY